MINETTEKATYVKIKEGRFAGDLGIKGETLSFGVSSVLIVRRGETHPMADDNFYPCTEDGIPSSDTIKRSRFATFSVDESGKLFLSNDPDFNGYTWVLEKGYDREPLRLTLFSGGYAYNSYRVSGHADAFDHPEFKRMMTKAGETAHY